MKGSPMNRNFGVGSPNKQKTVTAGRKKLATKNVAQQIKREELKGALKQKQQSSKVDKLSKEQRSQLGGDLAKWMKSSLSVSEFLKNRAKTLETLKDGAAKTTKTTAE